ncbi:MAG: DUF2723 domain-containing protein [Anaerolineae bacterium]|nr:DUF2723 domain-containing protein [Anaerolineae bacterium]
MRRRANKWWPLLLTGLALLRLTWQLDAKNLWWDESLSLQRAESAWPALLAGTLILSDGLHQVSTIDQHPFAYFALLGLLIRLAGTSEFVLRFPSAMASTALVPMAWSFARLLVRWNVAPSSAPYWAALLATFNPFYLWYGQEARMYTLVALLALVSTYVLLRWTEADGRPSQRKHLVIYGLTMALLLSTHYLTILLSPVHALVFYRRMAATGQGRALLSAGSVIGVGLLVGSTAGWLILRQGGSGTNFAPVSLRILIPDLLNAFSLGLSVDIARVWWLDGIFGGVALLGALWGLRSGRPGTCGGWLLPCFLAIPVALLSIINQVQPVYMNARHLSLISGAFLLLVAAGLGRLWQFRRWMGGAIAILLLGGALFSTVHYFTLPQYGKDDFSGLGDHLRQEIQPGDLLLLDPPQMVRLFRYYLPVDLIEHGAEAGLGTHWQGMPLFSSWTETEGLLEALRRRHQRIWLARSGMVPFGDPERRVEKWLEAHTFRVGELGFYSPYTYLKLYLFLPQVPVVDSPPNPIQYPLDVVFADQVRLAGYQVGRPLAPGSAIPVTLYWQALQPIERRYKYILRLIANSEDSLQELIAITEREPYDGALPTTQWRPGKTIIEYSGVRSPEPSKDKQGCCFLTVQMYDAETLEKLPITRSAGVQISEDGQTLILPHLP